MPRTRLPHAAPAASIVTAGLLLVLAVRAADSGGLPWAEPLAAMAAVGVAGYALALALGRIAAPGAARLRRLALLAAPPALALGAASGGARSPAAAVLLLCALSVAWGGGLRRAVLAAGAACAAVMALQAALGAAPGTGPAAMLLVAAGAIVVAPAALLGRARRVDAEAEVPTPARLTAPAIADDLRYDAVVRYTEREAQEERDAVAGYLREVRDSLGADEVVFWRHAPELGGLVAAAWSTEETDGPRFFDAAEFGPLVTWSIQEKMVHCAGSGVSPRLAVAPVADEGHVSGAVSVYAAAGLNVARGVLKLWLPRYAGHVALLARLMRTQFEYGREKRHAQALLDAAKEFQNNRSVELVGQSICATSLRVTSGTRAALVRWQPEERSGMVQSVSPGHPLPVGSVVECSSLVGQCCIEGMAQPWEDARGIASDGVIYGTGERRRAVGSLGVTPLEREGRIVGAIVIEGDAPGDVLQRDMRNVGLLAAMAAFSLETLWEMEEVLHRARTDQLTGLANRRHFDELFAQHCGQVDRSGNALSLIVVDIDFFKRVNDTFGHEAGDAVLRSVAATLKSAVRSVDLCARFGGEEIAILMPDTTLDGARELADRLREKVERRAVHFDGREISVTASFGVASYPQTAPSRDALFAAADRALYRAKAAGRNCVMTAHATNVAR